MDVFASILLLFLSLQEFCITLYLSLRHWSMHVKCLNLRVRIYACIAMCSLVMILYSHDFLKMFLILYSWQVVQY